MKIKKFFQSTLHQLILTYSLLTIMVTMIIGSTAAVYFSSSYNDAIERSHKELLEHLRVNIEQLVLEKATQVYLDMVNNPTFSKKLLYFYAHPLKGNHNMAKEIQDTLKNIIGNQSDLVNSIFIYYKPNHMFISSTAGLVNLDYEQNQPYAKLDWFLAMNNSSEKTMWFHTRPMPLSIDSDSSIVPSFTLVKTYPMLSTDFAKGYIALNINEEILSRIIQNLAPSETGSIFVIDKTGRIISHPNKDMLYHSLDKYPYIDKILSSPQKQNNFVDKINNINHVISYTTFNHTGWKLIKVDSSDTFYRESRGILLILFVICMISILVGLLFSWMLTNKMYHPLKKILMSISSLYQNSNSSSEPMAIENEYRYIDKLLKKLSFECKDLKNTLNKNYPILKYNLVNSLLYNRIITKEDFREHLKSLQISLRYSFFFCIILKIDSKVLSNISLKERQFIKYKIIEEMENVHILDTVFLASEISGNELGILVNSNTTDYASLTTPIESIMSKIYHQYYTTLIVSFGGYTDNPLDLYISFQQARSLFHFMYFLPEKKLYYGEDLLLRAESSDEIPETFFQHFKNSLFSRNFESVKAILSEFLYYTKEGNFSSQYCHQMILKVLYIFSSYMNDIQYSNSLDKKNLYQSFNHIENINDFEIWLSDYVQSVFHFLDTEKNLNPNETIKFVQQYILDHLSEDLSLEFLADQVHLESTYLSKLFKAETGINYIEFITEKRMEYAKELLGNFDLKIGDVAREVGYNTPSYFNAKFKNAYGMTPQKYRKTLVL